MGGVDEFEGSLLRDEIELDGVDLEEVFLLPLLLVALDVQLKLHVV